MLSVLPVLQEVDKAFLAQFNKYDPMMNQQTSLFMSMGMENPELMKAGFQAYHKIIANFDADMTLAVSDYMGGRATFDKTMKNFKGFSGKHYKDMFQAGAQAVGNEFYDQLGMDKRSLSFVNKARRAEMKFFKKFLTDIKNPWHTPRHPYKTRATYYTNSAKAQFFNGMVAGAGSEMEIYWRLGVPETQHCDICPTYAGHGPYTWQTLPTVPRGGDTPCLFRCYCHLEMKPRKGRLKGGDPDRMLQHGLRGSHPSPSRPTGNGQIADKKGRPLTDVPDELVQHHDDLRGRLNHARQMIETTTGAERAKWITIRKGINDMIITLQNQYPDMRFLPTMAVKDLSATIQSAMKKGELVTDHSQLMDGDEIVWTRGTRSGPGVVFRDATGQLGVKFADGTSILINSKHDISFLAGGKGLQQRMKMDAVKFFNSGKSQAELMAIIDKVDDWLQFSGVQGKANLDYISNLMGFPVTKEYVQNWVAKQRQLLKGMPSSQKKWATKNDLGDYVYSQTRVDVHEKIYKHFLDKGTYGNDMLMTGGYSASGKSSILNKLYPDWKNKYVMINSDDIKLMLAKNDGFAELQHRAGVYHAESADMLKELVRRAVTSGKNVMYDGTMRSFGKQAEWLKMYKDMGYKVTGIYADLPMEFCQQRACGRGMAGTDRRFVDPFLIQAQEGLTLETFKKMGDMFDDWYHYNTNVPPGTDPGMMGSKFMKATPTSALTGKSVTSIKPLGGGCNESWKVQFDDGTYAVYKPKAGERAGLRNNITHEYTREAIAYEIEKQLALGIVPETLVMDIPVPKVLGPPGYEHFTATQPSKGIGAYQLWKDGIMGANLTVQEYALIPLREKQKMVLFDLVTQQTDRHMKNWLFNTSTKKLVAIDNGLSMPKAGYEFRLSFGEAVAGTKIPADLKAKLQSFYDSKASFKATVRQALGGTLPLEEAKAIDRMFDRTKKLLDLGKYPWNCGQYDGQTFDIYSDGWE